MATGLYRRRRSRTLAFTSVALATLSASTLGQGFTPDFVSHSLRRATFGPKIQQLTDLSTLNAWITHFAAQIDGQILESPEFQTALGGYGVPLSPTADPNYGVWGIKELAQQQLFRAAFSENQLREVMTMFWQQSLSTNYYPTVDYLYNNASTHLNNVGSGGLSVPGANTYEQALNAAAYIMFLENESMRSNALGYFEDLLIASAQSPSMLIYLNSVENDLVNAADRANENYSRELLELHTLGVSDFTGEPYWYTYPDIAELAPAFSGWNVEAYAGSHGKVSYKFQFDVNEHRDAVGYPLTNPMGTGLFQNLQYTRNDPRYGNFPVQTFTGVNQGIEALKYLANAWETRAWVCRRLMDFFIGYSPMDPGDPLVISSAPGRPTRKVPLPVGLTEAELDTCYANCLSAWESGATGKAGNIQAVLATIFYSPAFWNVSSRWTRAKNPMEFAASLLRAYDAEMPTYTVAQNTGDLDEFMECVETDLGMPLFQFPSPDGYTIKSEEIISTNGSLHRANMAQEIIRDYLYYDPTGQLGGSAVGQVNMHPLGFLSPTLFESGTAIQRFLNAIAYLTNYSTNQGPFDLGSTTAITDRVFLGLFSGDISTESRTIAQAFWSTWETAQSPANPLQTRMTNSNPATNPNWWAEFTEAGNLTVGFMAYAAALPQFQLK